jgi:uncharacterized protein YhaN
MKTKETGHIMNVSGFEKLLEAVAGCGTAYNPSRQELQASSLSSYLSTARTAITELNAALADYENALANRRTLCNRIAPLITRLSNALKASVSEPEKLLQATQLIRKIRGIRVSHKFTASELEAISGQGIIIHQVSAAHTSLEQKCDNIDKLICLLETFPEYVPNEPDLTISGLRAFLQEIIQASGEFNKKTISLNLARKKRNEVLYGPVLGICDISKAVKAYLSSLFGQKDPIAVKARSLRIIKLS